MNCSVRAFASLAVISLALASASCGSRETAEDSAGRDQKTLQAKPAARTPAYEPTVIARLQATMGSPAHRAKIPQRGDAVRLCDKWIPIPQEAGWCDREADPTVRAMLVDASRLQEGGFSVSAEVMARNALAKAGSNASPAARALASAFVDMYKPTASPASDVADEQFNADLQRFWKVWEECQKLVAGVEPRNRPAVDLLLKGTLYRDQVAVDAAQGMNQLTESDRKLQANALARIAAFHESEGR